MKQLRLFSSCSPNIPLFGLLSFGILAFIINVFAVHCREFNFLSVSVLFVSLFLRGIRLPFALMFLLPVPALNNHVPIFYTYSSL